MPPKQAACQPCRLSKLACDHERPICGRCRKRNKLDSCSYRAAPFKKRRSLQSLTIQRSTTVQQSTAVDAASSPGPASSSPAIGGAHQILQHYPNPGYQGPSSHATIFGQLSPVVVGTLESPITRIQQVSHDEPEVSIEERYVLRGQNLLEHIHQDVSIESYVDLVSTWTATGVNLALAGSFIASCCESTARIFRESEVAAYTTYRLSQKLFSHSIRPLVFSDSSTIEDFRDQFTSDNIRWETLGLFFTAVSRATIDVSRFLGLYLSQRERFSLRRLALRLADECLDLCLSLDHLNDVQLFLQYENFINHSCAGGDQSYGSWKRLGDTISSLYALGFHMQTRADKKCPDFLRHLREAAFAFTFSADKNVSIFLGRPPRMHRDYCSVDFLYETEEDNLQCRKSYLGWHPEHPFNYQMEAWWSMFCALQKEKALNLPREKNLTVKNQQATAIQAETDQAWLSLPQRFQSKKALMFSSDSPIERDFLSSARLNCAHVQFLLQLALTERVGAPPTALITVSAEILSLVAEVTLVREHLVNSGTGILWRIAYYGLPAAGVICLTLLKRATSVQGLSLVKIFQDLGVLVAQIETGGLIDPIDANYALLIQASETIKSILHRVLPAISRTDGQAHESQTQPSYQTAQSSVEEWEPFIGIDNWQFEMDFWTNLADHPDLVLEH